MKLYTICDKENSLFDIKESYGVNLKDYSVKEYLNFMNDVKKLYIVRLFSWYETDMSDRDEGSIIDHYTINYNNVIIKDDKLFGVLVKTRGMFPKYRVVKFETEHKELALGGGYNSLDYDWWIKEIESKDSHLIDALSKYVVVEEYFSYEKGKLSMYLREVVNFAPRLCIVENDEILGFNYDEHEYLISDKRTHLHKTTSENGENKSIKIRQLMLIDEEFLNKNILDVNYDLFSKGEYKIMSE